jgi:hypothetical protein
MSVNQYNTRCTVDICKNGRVINIKHFTDLQMAYMWVQSQVPDTLLEHRGEFLKTFEYVIEKMLQYPSDGVVAGQTETTIYDLYFTEM